MKEPLARNKNDKILFGVCGGIARSYHIDSNMVRLITGLLCIPFTVLIPFTYLLLALLLKEE